MPSASCSARCATKDGAHDDQTSLRPPLDRHTFAARYLRDGNSLAALKRAGGWNSLGAVAVYAHLEQDAVDESVRSVTTPLSGVAHSAQRRGKDTAPELQIVGNAA